MKKEAKARHLIRSCLDRFHNLNLRPKLIIAYLISFLLPLSIMGGIFYVMSANRLEQELRQTSMQSVKQFNKIFDEYINQIDTITLMPYIETNVQRYLLKTSGAKTYEELYSAIRMESVTQFLENLLKVKRDIDFVSIVSLNGQVVTRSKYGFVKPQFTYINDPLYQPLRQSSGELTIIPTHSSDYMFAPSHPVFSVGRKILDFKEGFYSGYIVVDCNMDVFEKALAKIHIGQSGYFLVAGDDGSLLYSSNRSADKAGEDTSIIRNQHMIGNEMNTVEEINGKKMMVVGDRSPYTGWTVFAVMPHAEIQKNVETIKEMFIFLSICCIGLVLFFSVIISNSVTTPIRKLQKAMRSVEKGNTETRVMTHYTNEVGQLSQSFNRLIERIDDLLTVNRGIEVKKREAQLEALLSKMNPHFLYNTLESIRMMAVIEDKEDIAKAIEGLADLFRYSIRTKSDIVDIRDELQHVEHYIFLQKIRYGDKFEVCYDIDEELLPYKMLKFSLQPIVENALSHGVDKKLGKGIVNIRVHRYNEHDLRIIVEDDGVGMDTNRLSEMRQYLSSQEGDRGQSLGLKTIQERVALYFGPGYGLHIESDLGKGTTVMLTIPIFQEEKRVIENVIRISGG